MTLLMKPKYYLSIMQILIIIFRKNVCEVSAEEQYCLENIATNLKHPTTLSTWPKGNKLIVSEHGGRIYLLTPNSTSDFHKDIFLDITDRVLTTDAATEERGLLSFTLDPEFLNNRHLYVYYSASSVNGNHKTIISRFVADTYDLEKVDKSTEIIILEIPQPGPRQNGGHIFFGIDNYLYITTGDGGNLANKRFDKGSLLGKILRIDVSRTGKTFPYKIPYDNPFAWKKDMRKEIYAYGFRNPWRCTVDNGDPITGAGKGRIICGDNGEQHPNKEEIDLIVAGGRYGWMELSDSPCKTIEECKKLASKGKLPPSYQIPLYTYFHEGGQAIVGGVVYRGKELKSLYGTYVYADFVNGSIHFLNQTGPDDWSPGDVPLLLNSSDDNCTVINEKIFILGLSVDHEGEIIVMTTRNLSNLSPSGALHRLHISVKNESKNGNKKNGIKHIESSLISVTVISAIYFIIKQFYY